MKREILLVAAMCLTLAVSAQKAPKKSFSTDYHPVAGAQWQVDEKISLPDARTLEGVMKENGMQSILPRLYVNGSRHGLILRSRTSRW